jgi:uncharacterized integral membrane protein
MDLFRYRVRFGTQGQTLFLLNFLPSFLARKTYKGRQEIKRTLSKYYVARYDLELSIVRITKKRVILCRKHRMSDDNIGEFELSLLHGTLANIPQILFWLLLHILASPPISAAIRNELLSIIFSIFSIEEKHEVSINITKFESHYPLLISAYRETLNVENNNAIYYILYIILI